MRGYQSCEGGSQTNSGGKFYIRYQESVSFGRKQKPQRKKEEQPRKRAKSLIRSEADAQATPENTSTNGIATDRPKSKKRVLTQNITLTGSLSQVFQSQVNSPQSLVNQQQSSQQANHQSNQQLIMKEFSRIPIEYNDEKINGSLADYLKMRVVYRGYNPKNTYYFIKHLSGTALEQTNQQLILRGEFQLKFDAKMQSGNLSVAARKSSREFWLFMREDTNTRGLRQWYYFSVVNRKIGKFKFRIYKFSKFYSLYKQGMKPFCSENIQSDTWRQQGQNVRYSYDEELKCYFLEFQYSFDQKNMKIWFATQPPYTYTMLKKFLNTLKNQPCIQIKKIGSSLAGFDIPMIQVSQQNHQKKQAIVVLARTHPGQTASNFSIEAFVQSTLQNRALKSMYNFYIIPMVNPDGVFFGNHRTSVIGQDLNRNFRSYDLECFPEIQAIDKAINNIRASQNIRFLLDLHGHSARRNIFAYGDEQQIGSNRYLYARILPKILSNLISTFKYNYCVFKGCKQKKNTARVYFSKKMKLNALTFEQSYGLVNQGCIGIENWRNFGKSLVEGLYQFGTLFYQDGDQSLRMYLSDEIESDYIRLKQRLQKKLKIKLQKDFQTLKKKQQEKNGDGNSLDFNIVKNAIYASRQDDQSEKSVNSSELSSGNEDLELPDEELGVLKKQIGKIGCLKEGLKREAYNMAEKNLQIRNSVQPRMHQQKSSMIPRILKFQMKKKDSKVPFNFNGSMKERFEPKNSISMRKSIEFPSLKRQY